MHDNPLCIKVEVEDAGVSPSPAPKITKTDVEKKDLMSDVASLKAFAEEDHGVSRGCGVGCGGGVRCSSSCCDHDGDGGGGDNSGKPCAKNHTLVSTMDIMEASGAFMDHNIVGSHVEVVGIGESQQGRSCNKHHICGSQLRKGSYVCFRKTGLRGGAETRRMFSTYFTSTAELWDVRWGICQSIWPLELIVTTACVRALWRFTPAIEPVAPASQNARNTIVAWPLLREGVICL